MMTCGTSQTRSSGRIGAKMLWLAAQSVSMTLSRSSNRLSSIVISRKEMAPTWWAMMTSIRSVEFCIILVLSSVALDGCIVLNFE